MNEIVNERKHGRTALIVAVIAIALASVTIGYAYAAYTTNSGNDSAVEYLTIVPSDGTSAVYTDSFSKDIGLDTLTTPEGITYSMPDDSLVVIDGHEYVELGKIYLTVDETKSDDDYNVTVKVAGGTGLNLTDYRYSVFFRIGSGETAEDAQTNAEADEGSLVALADVSGDRSATSTTIENLEENGYSVVIAQVYVALASGDSILKPIGTGIGLTVLDDVTFSFAAKTI